MRSVIVCVLGVCVACTRDGAPKNRIMGTGEKTHVSVMTDVDRFHDAIRRNAGAEAIAAIRSGVDTKKPDAMGTPTLVLVARYTDDVALLDALGAVDVDAADTLKRTALSWAASQGHVAVTKALLERGAKIDQRDSTGKTPLFHAVLADARATARLLLERGANVDARDTLADTPLMLAAAKDNGAMVELLLAAGADSTIAGSGGRTAAMRATRDDVRAVLDRR